VLRLLLEFRIRVRADVASKACAVQAANSTRAAAQAHAGTKKPAALGRFFGGLDDVDAWRTVNRGILRYRNPSLIT